MGLKILLNIFYNVSILLLGMSVVWSFNRSRYELVAAAVFAIAMVVILKIRLIRQIKEITTKAES